MKNLRMRHGKEISMIKIAVSRKVCHTCDCGLVKTTVYNNQKYIIYPVGLQYFKLFYLDAKLNVAEVLLSIAGMSYTLLAFDSLLQW